MGCWAIFKIARTRSTGNPIASDNFFRRGFTPDPALTVSVSATVC